MKLYVATHNIGKRKEIEQICANTSIILVFPNPEETDGPEETASTFIENALIKARHGCLASGLATLGDDSGLVIPALQGKPGIFSARYAGSPSDSQKNIEKVLDEMIGITDRRAYFCCTMVLLLHEKDPSPIVAQGFWHGVILLKPQGTQGFGYDPIFSISGSNQSAAELTLEEKNKISHRGRALQQLKNMLEWPSI